MIPVVIGVDVGTSSTKGVVVDLEGRVLRSASREHSVDRPHPGWVEMSADVWWDEFVSLSNELLADESAPIAGVGVSGMGPCVALTDASGTALRPAILYGVDTRATAQIRRLNTELGEAAIRHRCGSLLSSQAAGPKIAWVADDEPDVYARARRLFMPSSWLAFQLTGEYVLDHHSASQCTPLYDVATHDWYRPWVETVAPCLDLPPLRWPGDQAGVVSREAAAVTGIPAGTPVITGTIDAWAEALSVGAHAAGDLMLMYGTTMFLVNTVKEPLSSPALWGTVGALPDTYNLAGGMATSGAVTSWLRDLFGGSEYSELMRLADQSPPGANGLVMLPYFAGERTPIMDPDARGIIAGLTLSHTRGDLYRAALEATGFAVRHNIEVLRGAGGDIDRVVAVGGGTQGGRWVQIVSDISGREQVVPTKTLGACFGGAFLAAQLTADVTIEDWNPVHHVCRPRPENHALYDRMYRIYRNLYPSTSELAHQLADIQTATSQGPRTPPKELS